jgi:CxxC-x17-CxxC domain-containing protein
MYEDKTLTCKDCGVDFIFTAGEQDFYAEKGLTNQPQRCKRCRDAKKAASGQRQMFETTCFDCGGIARVPFKPREGREDTPVYCSTCIDLHKRGF